MTRRSSPSVRWQPAAYAAHSSMQQVWGQELIDRLNLRGDERILDVGCGDGKITAALASRVAQGAVTGVDSSPAMIAFARTTFPPTAHPNLKFRVMDAADLQVDSPFDVLFSNAALHWVHDHPGFLHGASKCLRMHGQLLVSCGGHGNAQDVFTVLRATLRVKRWRPYFRKMEASYFFHHPQEYEQWLPTFGFKPLLVRLAEKDWVFANRDSLAGWLRTAWLPYTQRVPEAEREGFIAEVVDRYAVRFPADARGRLRVRMVRLEIEAVKQASGPAPR